MTPTTIDIRLLGAGDAAVLERVAPGTFDNDVHPLLAREFLGDSRHHIVVALDGDMVVGMISAVDYVHPDKERQLWINEVGVAPTHQRRGIARRMMTVMLEHGKTLGCTEAWLGAEESNAAARGLYEQAGGVPDPFLMYSFAL